MLKRLSSHDQLKSDQPVCEEIKDLTDQQQDELIADRFSSVSNEYSPVDASRLSIPPIEEGSVPQFTPLQVLEQLLKLKTMKATAPDVIPSVILKEYAEYICVPLCHLLNSCVLRGSILEYGRLNHRDPFQRSSQY